MWKWNSSGQYTVASFLKQVYEQHMPCSLPPEITDIVWKKRGPPRAQMKLWFLVRGRLKCGELLARLNIISIDNALCPWCDLEVESIQHLFFACKFAWGIWTQCLQLWDVHIALHKDSQVNMLSWSSLVVGKFKKQLWEWLFVVVIWSSWFERNEIKFGRSSKEFSQLIDLVKYRLIILFPMSI